MQGILQSPQQSLTVMGVLNTAHCPHNDAYTIDTDTLSDTQDDSNICGIRQLTFSYTYSIDYLPHLAACARPTADNAARSTTAEVLYIR